MFLKNYTSDVPVHQTIYRIEQVLLKCGVSGIMKEYGVNQSITAITFQIKLDPEKPWAVRLPVNVQKAWDVLWLDYADGNMLTADGMRVAYPASRRKKKHKGEFREQAERTAWKIVQDWVEVQMSMIQMQQADFREVFLPYLWDGKRSYFQAVKDAGFAGLLAEKSEAA